MSSLIKESSASSFHAGDTLPQAIRHIKQEDINLYAQASGDFNPIHIDEAFAARTPVGGTIAHGMLILAYVIQTITASFGPGWLSGGRLAVRFRTPARPGDTLAIGGKVKSIESQGGISYATCNVVCHNQKGEVVINGEARVGLPSQP